MEGVLIMGLREMKPAATLGGAHDVREPLDL